MYISTFQLSAGAASDDAVQALAGMKADGHTASFAALHHRAGTVDDLLLQTLKEHVPALHCASSCKGTMSQAGLQDLGLFVISDPDGDYGTAAAPLGDDTEAAATAATVAALENAQRDGEAPDLVWLSITPGNEEDAIRGIETVIGSDVPIIGGSAADDTVAGEWTVSDGSEQLGSGLVVSVLFCSTPIQFAYQNGYAPTADSGVVTKSEGRKLIEIDGEPAASVYSRWNGGGVPSAPEGGERNILSEATLWPLGREIGSLGDVPYYLLAHPCVTNDDGSLDLFAEVAEGEHLTQMQGDVAVLAARAGRVAEFALRAGSVKSDNVAGALMVYCGGCMLAVEDRLSDVYGGVNSVLGGQPFLGVFTFGEQGSVHEAGNRHGNLMISCIAFSKDP
ncbi:FIST signal transduction protein [Shimia ponticola]|uniref:FIST signal transduction protein n=1 Tax=Shimia ponticola TaxID=2582893 RepID=UPI00164A2A82|nr:FIST N-terminal domain-containing protein [Shimia ponticola]